MPFKGKFDELVESVLNGGGDVIKESDEDTIVHPDDDDQDDDGDVKTVGELVDAFYDNYKSLAGDRLWKLLSDVAADYDLEVRTSFDQSGADDSGHADDSDVLKAIPVDKELVNRVFTGASGNPGALKQYVEEYFESRR